MGEFTLFLAWFKPGRKLGRKSFAAKEPLLVAVALSGTISFSSRSSLGQ